jgi:hypothetical protein
LGAVLFWNTAKKSIASQLQILCDEFSIDVLALAECEMNPTEVLDALNGGALKGFSMIPDPDVGGKLRWFSRLPTSGVMRLLDGGGLSLVRVSFLSGIKILIGAVHLPSKINENDFEQLATASATVDAIQSIEEEQGLDTTIILGDFNMNPFDPGMAAITGFNAVMDRKIAMQKKVTFKKSQYKYFYNPMWGRMGDATRGPPGTFWYPRRLVRFHWNTYDQVLIRPSLLSQIYDDDIIVIGNSGGQLFAGSGQKWKCPSDHLPIVVKVKEVV